MEKYTFNTKQKKKKNIHVWKSNETQLKSSVSINRI